MACLSGLFVSSFDEVVAVLVKLGDEGLVTPAAMSAITCEELVTHIHAVDDDDDRSGPLLHKLAVDLTGAEYGGVVPNARDELLALGLSTDVVSLLMQHCFACTTYEIGHHGTMLAVALDLIDWEEYAPEGEHLVKQDVDMDIISAADVKNSLLTWLPMGEQRAILDIMETLAAFWGEDRKGNWGKGLDALMKHASVKDTNSLKKMATAVVQFYKAKSGRAREAKRPKVAPTTD